MTEDFFHYIWKYRLYNEDSMCDSHGNIIEVLHPGEYNRDAGPDFINARLRIEGLIWAGNIEIHTKASCFNRHRHYLDHAYDSVVLHVVGENDKNVFNSHGAEIMAVEVRYDPEVYLKYIEFLKNHYSIACQNEISDIDKGVISGWMEVLLDQRLRNKTERIGKVLKETGNNWEETLYIMIARYFGSRANSETFEQLTEIVPYRIIRRHADNLIQIEAMLFGSAGLLDDAVNEGANEENYYGLLKSEHKILSTKYSLGTIDGWLWKYARLRPSNFPSVRIAQFAALFAGEGRLFPKIIEAEEIKDVHDLFGISASGYWDRHYRFGKLSSRLPKKLGQQAIDILVINVVVPVLYYYGICNGKDVYVDRAISFLKETEVEKNFILNEWKEAGLAGSSAFQSQALIQLMNYYCKKQRCKDCEIGRKLIERNRPFIRGDQLALEP